MPCLLFYSPQDPQDLWLQALKENLGDDFTIRVSPDIGDVQDIDYALVYQPPPGLLASLPNLKLILSIAAGIDHILADPQRPKHLPIVRMVDTYLRDMMSEYALLAVLYFHRFMPEYLRDGPAGNWDRRWCRYTPDCHVGVLGLGAIGQDVAAKLGRLGFQVHGWSRSPKQIDGITCYAGANGFSAMLPQCQYLICVLPLTADTAQILDRKAFGLLPQGAYVINIGRGGHLVEADLLAALDSGHLAGAFLDVFATEPLPADDPLRRHPAVVLTPHVAGELLPRSCAKAVAANLRRHLAGAPIPDIVDLDRGY